MCNLHNFVHNWKIDKSIIAYHGPFLGYTSIVIYIFSSYVVVAVFLPEVGQSTQIRTVNESLTIPPKHDACKVLVDEFEHDFRQLCVSEPWEREAGAKFLEIVYISRTSTLVCRSFMRTKACRPGVNIHYEKKGRNFHRFFLLAIIKWLQLKKDYPRKKEKGLHFNAFFLCKDIFRL